MAYNQDIHVKIGTNEVCLDIIRRGYKPTWDKISLWQGTAASNPTVSLKASQFLDKEVQGLLDKDTIGEVQPVLGQYVSSYFAVPKSKQTPDK